MRLFQNFGLAARYHLELPRVLGAARGFAALRDALLADRYGASHVLQPVLTGDSDAFFTCGDTGALQRAWAVENGLPAHTDAADILLAQIEAHRTEVFYNLDPLAFDSSFLRRLPGHVRHKIAWRAAPGAVNLAGYDLVVNNFPSLRAGYEKAGLRTAAFYPAHDPDLNSYAANSDRDIDVLFFGGYSRHHGQRRTVLEAVARLSDRFRIAYHLDKSRFSGLAQTPLGWFGPLQAVRCPPAIRKIAQAAVWGRGVYQQLSRSKIVLNGAIDMAGSDRGNMRCFEAMGAAALLISDRGNHPPGMVDGETMRLYDDAESAVRLISEALESERWRGVAAGA